MKGGMKRPTTAQAGWLRRIAHSRLIKTYRHDNPQPRYSLQSGQTVPARIANVLIRNGWVKRSGDGLFGDTQTYEVLKR
jgi:hypothetical protein